MDLGFCGRPPALVGPSRHPRCGARQRFRLGQCRLERSGIGRSALRSHRDGHADAQRPLGPLVVCCGGAADAAAPRRRPPRRRSGHRNPGRPRPPRQLAIRSRRLCRAPCHRRFRLPCRRLDIHPRQWPLDAARPRPAARGSADPGRFTPGLARFRADLGRTPRTDRLGRLLVAYHGRQPARGLGPHPARHAPARRQGLGRMVARGPTRTRGNAQSLAVVPQCPWVEPGPHRVYSGGAAPGRNPRTARRQRPARRLAPPLALGNAGPLSPGLGGPVSFCRRNLGRHPPPCRAHGPALCRTFGAGILAGDSG